jgi:hypothetical protein
MMMESSTANIRDEVCRLVSAQVEAFGRRRPLTSSELCEFHIRNEEIKILCQQLDQLTARVIIEQRSKKAA